MIGTGIDVCVVEDDEDMRAEVVAALAREGFAVRGFGDSRELYAGLIERPAHMLVLDLGLPGEDGLSITRRLREICKAGILILTAESATETLVQCLTGGADAYLTKPVDFRELAATLVSVHRRVHGLAANDAAGFDWRLDRAGWALVTPNGERVSLTASERACLDLLFDQPNTAVSREALIKALGHDADYYLDHRLDMLLSRLRRKVRESTGRPLPVKSVRGVGFMISLRPA